MKTHFPTPPGTGNFWASDLSRYGHPPAPTGNVWFVQSTSANKGDTAGKGRSPDAPFATLDYAIGQATATNDDVIVVLPGHAETIAGAAGVALDVAGVSVVGIGHGRARPTFTMTNTDNSPSFDVSAANCVVDNLVLICDDDAQTAMMNVTATGVRVSRCEFVMASASKQAVLGILASDAADRIVIEDCHFHGTADAGVTSAISLGATDDAIVRRNVIMGAHATGGSIANTAAAINLVIEGNTVYNGTADGNNKAIVLHSSSTGLVLNNRLAIIDSSSPAPVTAAAAFVSGNYFTGAVGVTASTLM